MDDATKYYRDQFFQEAREILDQANDDLLRIEADPENVEALNAIFRGIHTIKGSAGSFDLNFVSDFAHHLENVLNQLREGRLELSPELVDVILSSLDQLNSLLEAVAAGNDIQVSPKIVNDLQVFIETVPGSQLDGEPTGEEAGLQANLLGVKPGSLLIPTDVLEALERDREQGLNIFKIETHYTSQHLAHGYDPLVLIKNIKHEAARYSVPAATTAVPGINDFEPLDLYLSPIAYISTPMTAGDLTDMAFDPDLITVTPWGLFPEISSPGSSAGSDYWPGLPEEIRIELKEFVDQGAPVYRLDLHFTDEHLEHGYDLLVLLKNLKKTCPFYRVIEAGHLPPVLVDFEPLHLYLNPSIIVAGRVTREQIEDLAFDPGLLSITPIGPVAAGQLLTDSGLNIDPEDLEEFLVGSFELLDNLEKSAMIFEAQGDLGSLNEIFRAVHTIKGDSDYLGLKELAGFSHALESMLEQLRNQTLKRSPDTVDILLQSADYLRQSINALRQGRLITDLPPIFDHLNTFLHQDTAQAGSKTEPSGYDHDIGRAFIVQARQKADLLQAFLKKDYMDEKDRRNLERGLAGLVMAAGVVGLDSLKTPVQFALSELALGNSSRFRDRAAEVLAFVRGLEEEPKRIGEILVEEGKITVEELQASLAQQKPLGAILVARGKVQEEDVNRALNKQNLMETARQSRPAITAEPEVRTMRVDERKIDQFGNFVGELLVVRNTYEYLIKQLGDLDASHRDIIKTIRENQHLLTRLTNDIHHGVMALRMIPIRGIFQRFQRVVRDISRKQKKDIQYITEGEELEIDKKVGDILADPLIHLIRNACDHGIETMFDRRNAGKTGKSLGCTPSIPGREQSEHPDHGRWSRDQSPKTV